jgi:DNA primase
LNGLYYRREDVLRSLSRSDIESVFQTYIHGWVEKPKVTKLGNQLRFGSKGGFVVNHDTGQWYSHYHGEGGDIFSFLSRTQKIPYAQVIRELGEKSKTIPSSYQHLAHTQERFKAWEETKQAEEIIKLKAAHLKIQKLYEKSQVIQGTLAEKYLREHRHIKETALPSYLRFIPAYKDPATNTFYPALVAFASNAHGKICAAQITYLDPITGNKANVEVKKRSQGVIKGSAVEIQKGEGATYIVEGIETALSLKEANLKGRILATLGLSNIANVSSYLKNKEEPVILVGDADTPQSAPWKTSLKAIHTLKTQGFSVTLIRPEGDNGRDFNDVLQEEGVTALKAAFKDTNVLKEIFSQDRTKAGFIKEQTVFDQSLLSAETYEKEKLQNLSQILDPTTQKFLKENPDVSVETLKKWDQEFESEKKAYLASMTSSRDNSSVTQPALNLSDVVSTYQHLKWKLDNIKNPQRLAEAEKAMENLVINAYKDPQLIKMLQIRHKDIAYDLKEKHEILKKQQLYSRIPTFDM